MGRYTLLKANVCMVVAFLLVLLVTPVSAPAAAPAPTPAVERLKFATTAPWIEVVLSWQGGSFATNLIVRTFAEPLIETDPCTGELIPGLAPSREVTTPDAQTWTFQIR